MKTNFFDQRDKQIYDDQEKLNQSVFFFGNF